MKDRRFFSITALAAACILLVTYGVQWLIALITGAFFPQVTGSVYYTWLASYLPLFAGGFVVYALFMRILPKQELYRPGMTPGYWGRAFCVCIAVLYGAALLGNLVSNQIKGSARAETAEFESLMNDSPLWLMILIVVVAGPVLEELVFRKLMIDRLIVFGDIPAILFSAILFSLYHATFSQMFYTFLIGLILGYVYIRSGRIHNTILLHMSINFVGSIVGILFSRISGLSLDDLSAIQLSELPLNSMYLLGGYELFLVIVVIFGIAFLIRALRRLELRPGERSRRAPVMAGRMFINIGFAVFLAVTLVILLER